MCMEGAVSCVPSWAWYLDSISDAQTVLYQQANQGCVTVCLCVYVRVAVSCAFLRAPQGDTAEACVLEGANKPDNKIILSMCF